MKNKLWICILAFVLLISSTNAQEVCAGKRTSSSSAVVNKERNESQWNFTDANIVTKDDALVIPEKSSTKYTKVISKQIAEKNEGTSMLISTDVDLTLQALPKGEQFIFAFGLSSIDAQSQDKGNVELIFTNEQGIKLSVAVYGENGEEIILSKKSCGVSLKTRFSLNAEISTAGVLSISINNNKVCKEQLSVSGEGRFGILQSGKCGAEIYELVTKSYYYDRPQNMNISEDFENGEWNANVLAGHMFATNGFVNSGMAIEEYNGNHVLMFRNAGNAWFGTKLKYSNFEVSFDIPFYQKNSTYENGKMTVKATSPVGLGFGEEVQSPTGDEHKTDTDMLYFATTYAKSNLQKLWEADYEKLGLEGISGGEKENIGYSVKLTVVDSHAVIQVKALNSTKYTTIAETDYEDFREGYIKIWSTSANASFAIDNFKVTNLDENPALTEVEYKSSVLVVKDYELTEEEQELVFREEVQTDEVVQDKQPNYGFYIIGGSGATAVLLVLTGVIIGCRMKHKTRKETQKNEKN